MFTTAVLTAFHTPDTKTEMAEIDFHTPLTKTEALKLTSGASSNSPQEAKKFVLCDSVPAGYIPQPTAALYSMISS